MPESDDDRRESSPCLASPRWKAAGLTILVATGLLVLFACDPAKSAFYPQCPFLALTGFCCPGCGTLRALHQVLHGHLMEAFRLNPLAVFFLPFLGYAFLCRVVRLGSGRRMPVVFVPAIWIWILLGVIVSFWVLRNVRGHPFSLPPPGG